MNRNDRKIALAAIGVALAALGGIWLAGSEDEALPTTVVASDTLRTMTGHHRPVVKEGPLPVRHVETFPFDPNTADSSQLIRLGLQSWQVRNIYKYRARGGVYRKKEDFARLYGLTVKDYHRLEPYIRISSDYQPAATLVGGKANGANGANGTNGVYPRKIDSTQHVVLNTADTTTLRQVPGIGIYFAKEIVRYGQRLGGYVSVDQLDEIADFPQASKKYFVVQQAHPKKLNVNQLTLQQLRRHPYINYYQARAIKEYCRLHGPLKSLDDLRLSRDFPPEVIQRLAPYVTF
ncbi:DNA uptake protein ComE [Prevotella sp. tc2-28]|uniref:ComEA family DNA-binding protein n=1 Tax=Prevotella sp. tc2-28 TaxID=1761888 RepID=UPI000895E922|nr:helix-hairpin-helix domain-containing protein [Prevotella sp. tc2-28]SEA73395.1 DNA uptake protein ComE [Prevotella sp. tc2-28]